MVKNTIKLATLLILAYLWFPTLDPSDFIITGTIISIIGLDLYIILSAVFIVILYKTIEGKTIKDKINTVKKEIKGVIK